MNQKHPIYNELSKRILVLDGAMGSLIQEYRLTDSDYHGERFKDSAIELLGNNDVLSLTKPWIIEEIHEKGKATLCTLIIY